MLQRRLYTGGVLAAIGRNRNFCLTLAVGRRVAGCEGNLNKEYKNIKILAVASKSQLFADNTGNTSFVILFCVIFVVLFLCALCAPVGDACHSNLERSKLLRLCKV